MGRACVVVVVVHLLTAATVTALVVMPNDDLCESWCVGRRRQYVDWRGGSVSRSHVARVLRLTDGLAPWHSEWRVLYDVVEAYCNAATSGNGYGSCPEPYGTRPLRTMLFRTMLWPLMIPEFPKMNLKNNSNYSKK
jgi:hypothetical protein